MEQIEEHRTIKFHQKMTDMNSSYTSNRIASSSQKTIKHSTRSSLNGLVKSTPTSSEIKSEEELLKDRGISFVESNIRNFSNISPIEVGDYYKSLGEWQDLLPKTDYTYSPLSAYNKKKINGIYPVLPNMSRRKLWSNQYDSTVLEDNRLNSFYDKQYSRTTCKRWFLREDVNDFSKRKFYSEPASSSSSTRSSSSWTNFRQWISNKRSSLSQTSVKLYWLWRSYYESIRTKSSSLSFSSSSASRSWFRNLVQHVFPFLLLFLMLYLFLWSPVSTPSSSPVIDNLYKYSVIVRSTFSRIIQSLFILVCSFIESTLAGGTFILSCISWPPDFSLRTVPDFVFAPLWSFLTPPSAERTTENERIRLDDAHVEELFRQLFHSHSTEFTRKITSMVQEKLKEFEEEQKRAYEKLVDDRTSFEERFKVLEMLVMGSNVSEQIKELREEVLKLREEVKSKETKIQNDFFILLSTVLQTEPGEETNFDDLKAKFVSIFRSIEETHFKVDRLKQDFLNYAHNASDRVDIVVERSRERIKLELKSTVEELMASKFEEWRRTPGTRTKVDLHGDVEVLEAYVKEIVQQALDVYDADKTGMADYALESSGGIVLSTRCTETKKSHAQFSILGIPFWQTSRSPRTVIQPDTHPGECWAFPGSTGYLVIQLSQSIYITGVSLEHIPKAIAANGTIDSAPKDFSVWALRSETDPEAKFLGKFKYDDNGSSVQSFEANPLDQPYQIVELKILSNHGRIDYTCLYRFRVHGIPV